MLQRYRLLAILFCIIISIITINVTAQEEGQPQKFSQKQIPSDEILKRLTPEQIKKIREQQKSEEEAEPTETEEEKAEKIEKEKTSDEETEKTTTEEEVKEKAEEEIAEEETKEEIKEKKELKQISEPTLKRFGDNFFKPIRERILKIEEQKGTLASVEVKDAITGFVGPVDMTNANVNATIPQDYTIRPGDKISIIYWTRETTEPNTMNLIVDSEGQVIVPKVGKISVHGMTLQQFEKSVQDMLARITYEDLHLIATFDKLRSIQIFIVGNAFRPGTYAVSSVTSLFNALYLCGGPDEHGSLREITLLRGKNSFKVDFYKYLMDGNSKQDYNLQGGDTIFISPVKKLVSISGEINRPGIYELKNNQNLMSLIDMGRGIRSSGLKKRVQIRSIRPNEERIVIDVNLNDQPENNQILYDGDEVFVFPVVPEYEYLPEYQNSVELEGSVRRPGTYELKKDMTVSELIKTADGILGEAYLNRADLFRLNHDMRTTSLIPIDLGKALSGNPEHDITLERWDRLAVYSKWDVKWIADREVNAQGAVSKSGSFERSDNMRVNDLLIHAGGVTPEAYTKKAILFRLDERHRVARSISLNLNLVMQQDEDENILLKDGDTLYVYKWEEVKWEPKREVTSTGNIQNPGTYKWVENMRVSDLIYQSGGVLPDTADTALLLRMDEERWRIGESIKVNLKEVINGNPNVDLKLLKGDVLTVYKKEEVKWEPTPEVSISGAVQNGGKFPRVEDMRISDLVFRAGGLLPTAYLERADLIRPVPPNYEQFETIPIELGKAMAGKPESDQLLHDQDSLKVYTISEAKYVPEHIVTIYGSVQRPDTYMKTKEMHLSDLVFAAGGITPGAGEVIEIAKAQTYEKTEIQKVGLSEFQEGNIDPLLDDGDVVTIAKRKDFIDKPRYVTIRGEVNRPGTYVLESEKMKLSQLIERAGGLTDDAYSRGAIFQRIESNIISADQQFQAKRIWENVRREKRLEYIRQLAKSRAKSETSRKADETLATTTPALSPIAANVLSPTSAVETVGTAVEEVTETIVGETSTEEEIVESTISISDEQKEEKTEISPEETEISSEETKVIQAGMQVNLVTPARDIDIELPSKRVLIDLEKAIKFPGSEYDITLKQGDEITVSTKPISVTVIGAVINPISLVYREDTAIDDYIKMTGGYTNDADKKAVYVIRANGIATHRKELTKILPGDLIVVPTKVMVEEVTDRWGQFVSVIKFAAVTVSTAYLIGLVLKK